jgi:hypothetical protein
VEELVTSAKKPLLFNSPLETGVRSVVLLDAATHRAYDLTHLTWLDHLVVHTHDLPGGPPSLHPDIPQRSGELIVRRTVIDEGLKLMARLHLVDIRYSDEGILYAATEEASLFVQLIRTEYGEVLKQRASWLIHYVTNSDPAFLANLIHEKVGRWKVEFQDSGTA